MRFMLLYQNDETAGSGAPHPDVMAAMGGLIEEMSSAGVLVSTEGLKPSSAGARLHAADEQITLTDGPFTEAKELVAGYAIVDVDSRDEAIRWARRFLDLHVRVLGASFRGTSEVRQMYEAADFADGPCAGGMAEAAVA